MRLLGIAWLLLLILTPLSLRAGDRWGLLIGVDNYQQYPALDFCGSDVQALGQTLVKGGFDAEQVVVLRDQADDKSLLPLRENFQRQFDRVLSSIDDNDLLVAGFCGRLTAKDGKGLLCFSDSDPARPDSMLPLDALYERFAASRAAVKVLVLDVFRVDAAALPKQEEHAGAEDEAIFEALARAPKGLAVIASCSKGQVSICSQEQKGGVFLTCFRRGLSGAADNNGDKIVSLEEAVKYAAEKTTQEVDMLARRRQTPIAFGDSSRKAMNHPLAYALLESANAYRNRGFAWALAGNYQLAIKDYSESILREPRNPEGYLRRGMLWAMTREFNKAIDDFEKLIALEPRRPEHYVLRGAALLDAGKYDKAIQDLDRAIRGESKNAAAFFLRGVAFRKKRDYGKSLENFDQAVLLDPANTEYLLSRAEVTRRRGEYEKAIADVSEALRLKPRSSGAFNSRGLIFYEQKKLDEALADYNESLRLGPKNTHALNNRGRLWLDRDEYDKAFADFEKTLQIDPEYVHAYNSRGRIWFAREEYDKALADYNRAIALDPNYVHAYNNRGRIWLARNQYDKALEDFNWSLAIDADYDHAYFNRGRVRYRQREYAKAIANFKKAIQVDAQFHRAHNSLAWLWATCPAAGFRDGKQAVASATKACEIKQWKDEIYLDTLAAAYAEAGDFDKAIATQEKAIALANEKDRPPFQTRLELYRRGQPYRQKDPAAPVPF